LNKQEELDMRFLALWDYAIILVYFVILIVIGVVLKRRASINLESYFLAGRKMPWWALGISSMAAWFDMTGTMVITSFLYLLGPRGLYIEFRGGACLALAFLMLWTGKYHRRSGCITGAEWMKYRFGGDFWGQFARITMAVSFVVYVTGLLAMAFKGAGLFLSMFMPFSPGVCALILMVVTIIYTLEAGFYGVVVTDIFQSLCIWVTVIFVALMAFNKISASGDLAGIAYAVTGNQGWTTSAPQWRTSMPKGYENYSLLSLMAFFYLIRASMDGLGKGHDPKYFGARSDRECGLLSFLSGWLMMVRWPLMIGFAVLGLFLVKDLFPDQTILSQASQLIKQQVGDLGKNHWAEVVANIMNHPGAYPPAFIDGLHRLMGDTWARKLSLLSYEGTVDPERILPAVMLFNMPFGLRGLVLVALLAAGMSTFNAYINMATGFFTRDIYQAYIRPYASNKEYMWASYAFGTVLVTSGLLLAYTAESINHIWGWLMMGLAGGLGIPLVLRLYWWRFNGGGFGIGTLVGMLSAFVQRIYWSHAPEWLQLVIVVAAGLAGGLIGTFLTQPTNESVLEHFYSTTRPMGFWRPFKRLLSPSLRIATEQEHRHDLLSVPFALGWQITILLLPMQLIIHAYHAFFTTLIILVICLVGLYFFWYRYLEDLDVKPKHNGQSEYTPSAACDAVKNT
jgi:SSS family solute:Na+ symporter